MDLKMACETRLDYIAKNHNARKMHKDDLEQYKVGTTLRRSEMSATSF